MVAPATDKQQAPTHRLKLNVSILLFLFHIGRLKIHRWLSVKSMPLNFLVVVNVLLPICYHIRSGKPYLHIFVDVMVALLRAMTDK